MPTQTSHITSKTVCIYLTVDDSAPILALLTEAKELATREGKMVMFAIPSYGYIFQVTNQSNIEDMAVEYHDQYDSRMIIT